MSTPWSPPVELSPREELLCRKLEKHRRFFRFLRLHRHQLFADGFEAKLLALYSDAPRGTKPKAPAQLLLVVLLQAFTGASDDDAVQNCETDLRWQLVLDCLDADKAPFQRTTLVDFRTRLTKADFLSEVLKRTADLARDSGDFDAKKVAKLRIAIDSLPLQGAGRVEDTLNLLARALRLLVIAISATVLLTPEQIYAEAGLRILAAKSPKTGLDRDWDQTGAMDSALTDLMNEVESMQRWVRTQHPDLLQLRQVHAAQAQLQKLIVQDTEPCASGGHRIIQDTAPNRQMSLFDPEMRHGRKSKSEQIEGYKVYLAQDLDLDVTRAACVLPANQAEKDGADKLAPALKSQGEVTELHIDRAFMTSQLSLEVSRVDLHAVICRGRKASKGERFGKSDFRLDFETQQATCPAGQKAPIRLVGPKRVATFGAELCQSCPQRLQCQPEAGRAQRKIVLLPHEELAQATAKTARTPAGRARLRERVKVEHANARQARKSGGRARYVGVAKNDFDANRIAAANNLQLLDRRWRAAEAPEVAVASVVNRN